MRLTVMLIVYLVFPTISIAQTTWYVPDDFASIQGAISDTSVVDGDTVIVRPGTYLENLDFIGKAITVRSAAGALLTVIDGGHSTDPRYGSCVRFRAGEMRDSVLDGFTLTNGKGTDWISNGNTWGGGIYCEASPTISNNIISFNSCTIHGGGLFVNASPNFHSPDIQNNIISNNVCIKFGGGIACFQSDGPVRNNIIHHNEALYGGGIYCNSSPASSPQVIVNNVVMDNQANYGGGAFFESSCFVKLVNCTFVGNSTNGPGGGIACMNYGNPTLINTILHGNTATGTGKQIWLGHSTTGKYSFMNIDFSCVEGGQPGIYVTSGCTLNWGNGNIEADPLLNNIAMDDIHLTHGSPCRDAGDTSVVIEPIDFEGDPRIAQGAVDMGADEFSPHLYITGDKTPGGAIELNLTGVPGSSPVAYFIGTDVWDPPLAWWPYGLWYLKPPAIGPYVLGSIPSPDGVITLSGNIPASPPAPYTVYIHGLIGSTSTNLETLSVH